MARSAHRIKGAARMVGAHALQRLCANIEIAAQQGDISQSRALAIASLADLVKDTEHAISLYLDTRGA